MIDASDGLGADLGHIANGSGVGVRLEAVPVAPGATLDEALEGGEDFALAFCVPASAAEAAIFAGSAPPVRIGVCTADPGSARRPGRSFSAAGWEHRW